MVEEKEEEVKNEPNEENVSRGKRSRAAGARFELKVRKDLEEKGWITDKWTKNVDLEKMELIPAKRKFNPFNRVMTIGTGFPDFIAFKQIVGRKEDEFHAYKVVGVESKMNGSLDRQEKEKCFFLLERGVFKDILIASKGDKGKIIYKDYVSGEERGVF